MTTSASNSPLVSVIVPCYNHESYIASCIDSIITQDYANIEVIIIDDGSSDTSAEIIKQLASRDSRIIYEINQKNIGLSATLNKALQKYAKGKYVIQIASDDMLYPERIKKQVLFMESNPHFGMAYSDAIIINDEGTKIGELKNQGNSGWLFDDLFLCRFNIPAYTCIYKTEIFKEVGYYDENALIEDSDIWYKITKKYQVGYLNIMAAYYRRHAGNTSRKHLAMYKDTIQRLEKYKNEPHHNLALRNARLRSFFMLSQSTRKEALQLLPYVITQPGSKFFWGGLLNLAGLGGVLRKVNELKNGAGDIY